MFKNIICQILNIVFDKYKKKRNLESKMPNLSEKCICMRKKQKTGTS